MNVLDPIFVLRLIIGGSTFYVVLVLLHYWYEDYKQKKAERRY